MDRPQLLSMTAAEMEEAVGGGFRARQIAEWVRKGADFAEMTNLPKALRASLEERFIANPVTIREALVQGETEKYLYALPDGNVIEGVKLKYHYGSSLCVSTQVGCAMGCAFCASTLEGCVVRVSDMIAYVGKDRADALDMGVIDSLDVFDSEVIGRDNARIINNLTVDLVNTSYGTDRIALSEEAFADLKRAKRQNYELIYEREGMVNGAGNIVEEMFEELYERLLEDLLAGDEGSPVFKHHAASLAAKSRTVEIDEYLASDPNQVVVDYMASMTDSYFMALYAHLFPRSKKRIITRGYCSDLG